MFVYPFALLQYGFATKGDVLLLGVGMLAGVAHGASFAILAVLFGRMVDTFLNAIKVNTNSKYVSLNNYFI